MFENAINALWLAVIRQAIEDHAMWREIQAGRKKSPLKWKTVMYQRGYSWIENGGPDFQEVCNMADIDPARVQAAARKISLEQLKRR